MSVEELRRYQLVQGHYGEYFRATYFADYISAIALREPWQRFQSVIAHCMRDPVFQGIDLVGADQNSPLSNSQFITGYWSTGGMGYLRASKRFASEVWVPSQADLKVSEMRLLQYDIVITENSLSDWIDVINHWLGMPPVVNVARLNSFDPPQLPGDIGDRSIFENIFGFEVSLYSLASSITYAKLEDFRKKIAIGRVPRFRELNSSTRTLSFSDRVQIGEGWSQREFFAAAPYKGRVARFLTGNDASIQLPVGAGMKVVILQFWVADIDSTEHIVVRFDGKVVDGDFFYPDANDMHIVSFKGSISVGNSGGVLKITYARTPQIIENRIWVIFVDVIGSPFFYDFK